MDKYQIIVYPGKELPEAYKPMVFSKWLRSLRYGNDYFKLIHQDSYYSNYHRFLKGLLDQPGTEVRLMVLEDDRDVVLGFSVSRGYVLDYVHVHRDYRRQGFGTALIEKKSTIVITHITRQGMSFWNNRLKDAAFNPFI